MLNSSVICMLLLILYCTNITLRHDVHLTVLRPFHEIGKVGKFGGKLWK